MDEDTGLRHPYELVGGKDYLLAFMENSALDFGQQIHLYMAVAPDASSQFVDVTIRYSYPPCLRHIVLSMTSDCLSSALQSTPQIKWHTHEYSEDHERQVSYGQSRPHTRRHLWLHTVSTSIL